MSLPIHKKLFWQTKNALQIRFSRVGAPGLLSHRRDKQDYKFGAILRPDFGLSQYLETSIAPHLWVYDQKQFNCCVWASTTQAASFQEGKRFSVRFAVAMARKHRKLSGNGWASLRAGMEIATEVGRLPYAMMPDEIGGMGWEEYSQPLITQAMLDEALRWRANDYQKISNLDEAIKALKGGYTLMTGIKWYTAMNSPQPIDYYLEPLGDYYGGHAIVLSDYRENKKDFVNPQTFGTKYGENGIASLRQLFGRGHFDVYVLEKLPRTDLERTLEVFSGKAVRGVGAPIYRIENGEKRGYPNMDTFLRDFPDQKFYSLPDGVLTQIPDGKLIPSV